MKYAIAIDLGGTHLRTALIDRSGTIADVKRVETQADAGPDAGITQIANATRSVLDEASSTGIVGIGIAAPGPVDHKRGLVKSPPNLAGWGEVALADRVEALLDVPVCLGNDANLAALGEHRYGAGQGFANVIYVTVSTGIGGGIIVDNELLLGERGLAAEVGHIPLVVEGPLCPCGNRGHLEALASGPSIAREARAALQRGIESSLASLGHELTAVDVTDAARAGDHLAKEVLARAGRFLGLGFVTLVHLFDTERFVIGGGVSNAGDLLLEPARHTAREHVMKPYRDTFDVVLAELGDDVGLMGAAALVFDRLAA